MSAATPIDFDTDTTPIDYRLTENAAFNALDAAAARTVRAMLDGGMHWRDVGRWLVELSKEADRCPDVEALLVLTARVEAGTR